MKKQDLLEKANHYDFFNLLPGIIGEIKSYSDEIQDEDVLEVRCKSARRCNRSGFCSRFYVVVYLNLFLLLFVFLFVCLFVCLFVSFFCSFAVVVVAKSNKVQ